MFLAAKRRGAIFAGNTANITRWKNNFFSGNAKCYFNFDIFHRDCNIKLLNGNENPSLWKLLNILL